MSAAQQATQNPSAASGQIQEPMLPQVTDLPQATESEDLDMALESPETNEANEAEAFRKWIELEVLKIMKQQVNNSDVSQERIQAMANRTLDMVQPGMTVQQLFQKAILLNDGYPEFDSLTVKLIKEYEHKFKKKAVEQVAELVKSGDLDEAQDIVKRVLEFKMM